ncbi:MAG: fluoride efflux transporter CrcB [Litoreibacter sp.]|nr:fluoride efflux transporter CrcB [Litoreibacter sp.]
MFMTTLQVAIGGAIGAALRFLLGHAVFKAAGPGFPLGVLSVNILGSFAMGLFVVFAAKTANTHLSPFVMTGILGGFTTFSAFSLEAYTLFERGQTGAAALYVGLSVTLSIAALVAGIALARGVWA